MYHFLSGYTAKVAGTEAGVQGAQATFSTAFGAPFLPLRPKVYAEMLGRRLREHNAQCWLVNTGWTGGGYGVGHRFSLPYTRAMMRALLDGRLAQASFVTESAFGLSIPTSCPDVPAELLNPRNAWKDKNAYDRSASELTWRRRVSAPHVPWGAAPYPAKARARCAGGQRDGEYTLWAVAGYQFVVFPVPAGYRRPSPE